MKNLLKTLLLTLLLGVFVISVPGRAFAEISKSEDNPVVTGDNIISGIQYVEDTDGKIMMVVKLNWAKVKPYSDFKFYITDGSKNLIATEPAKNGSDFFVSSSDTPILYSFNTKLNPGTKYYIGGYADAKGYSASDLVAITTPSIVSNPYQSIETISMSDVFKDYSGTITASSGNKDRYKIYKLDVVEDGVLELADFTYSTMDIKLILLKMDSAPANSQDITNKDNIEYEVTYNNKHIFKSYILTKGSYYLAVNGPDQSTYNLKLKVRKYRHAKIKWTIKEGAIDSAFKQNQQLHVTFEITNADSDAYMGPVTLWSCAGHHEDSKVTVSNNGKKGEFTFVTGSFPNVETISLTIKELNPEWKPGKVNDETIYTLDVTTGISMTEIPILSGPDYIEFPDFRSYQFSQDGSTKINVYLKSGSKWKKKFTVDAGSRISKKIKKLKPKKKYQVKVEIVKTVKDGKQVKTSKVYKIKTGPKITPVISSARIDKVWNDKVWVPGHFNASGRWEKGYYSNNKYYTMTITLKKKLKGCKGIYVNGQKVKGTGTSFTFTVAHSDPPSSIKVKGYTDNKFFGLTKESKKKKTTR